MFTQKKVNLPTLLHDPLAKKCASSLYLLFTGFFFVINMTYMAKPNV